MSFFVEPLDTEREYFRASVQETASAKSTPITITAAGTAGTPEVLSWGTGASGWQLSMPTCELSNTGAVGSLVPGPWEIKEVVYMMVYKAPYPFDTDVHSVVLIFHRGVGASVARVAVRVLKETFAAKFKPAIATIATGTAVLFATIPDSQMQDSVAPLAASATSLPLAFPRIAVSFGEVVFGARANTAINPLAHHTAHVTTANTGTMYFGMVGRRYLDILKTTSYKYGSKPLWTTATLASPTLKLVVGPTLASDGLVDHATLAPGTEVELTSASTQTARCFVSTAPSTVTISFCPSTGKLEYGGATYTLAEVLYVPDVIGGYTPDNVAVVKWAYVLHFRSAAATSFALRLGPENADMLISVVGMHGMPLTKTVPTSTAIHANSRVALLPPWPNAHSQGTSAAAAVTAAAALPVRPANAPPVAPSLMPLNRARMIHYPAFEYTPAPPTGAAVQVIVTAPSVVVRYEPIPTCDQYKARGTASTNNNWDMWPLCAADASARALSPACGVFKSCPPATAATPGTSAATLIDARVTSPVTVPLYLSNETGVLYGLSGSAVYVVRPAALVLDAWSGPSDVTHVVIATATSTERLTATKDIAAAATAATAESTVYRIVAAGQPGQLALPCASLVTCMKGTDLASCSSGLFVDCAEAEDRSPVVATLEYNSLQVSLRQLDADVLYGIDARGAFALHKRTGSVLHTLGLKWPSWPSVALTASAPMVLKATLDSTGIWRVGGAASSKAGLLPLWITLGVLGGLLLIVAMIVFLKRR